MSGTDAPLVSFVMPCYNHERYVAECLSSILTQEGDFSFEVIAADDASTDTSQDIIRSFNDPRLRIIAHTDNQGHAATFTEALSMTRGSFVARIDADDRYCPDFLSITLEKFTTFPAVGVVYGDVALIDDQGDVTARSVDRQHGGKDFKGNELVPLLRENFICAPTVIARREAWLHALPIPDGLAFNDWYFTLMMARKYDFYYIDHELADYRVHGANMHTAIIRSGTEEPSIFRLLDSIFAERETDVQLQTAKVRARRRVYASHYLTLADKYFGLEMDADARRCYLHAIGSRPALVLHTDVVRHLMGTLLGRRNYDRTKVSFKRLAGVVRSARR
jgi:glycosyltransferase involved in cell wall biosynthesis